MKGLMLNKKSHLSSGVPPVYDDKKALAAFLFFPPMTDFSENFTPSRFAQKALQGMAAGLPMKKGSCDLVTAYLLNIVWRSSLKRRNLDV